MNKNYSKRLISSPPTKLKKKHGFLSVLEMGNAGSVQEVLHDERDHEGEQKELHQHQQLHQHKRSSEYKKQAANANTSPILLDHWMHGNSTVSCTNPLFQKSLMDDHSSDQSPKEVSEQTLDSENTPGNQKDSIQIKLKKHVRNMSLLEKRKAITSSITSVFRVPMKQQIMKESKRSGCGGFELCITFVFVALLVAVLFISQELFISLDIAEEIPSLQVCSHYVSPLSCS